MYIILLLLLLRESALKLLTLREEKKNKKDPRCKVEPNPTESDSRSTPGRFSVTLYQLIEHVSPTQVYKQTARLSRSVSE